MIVRIEIYNMKKSFKKTTVKFCYVIVRIEINNIKKSFKKFMIIII